MSKRARITAFGSTALLLALPALALDSVTLRAPGADEALTKTLENASILIRQHEEQEAAIKAAQPKWYMPWRRQPRTVEPLEASAIMASARAEYERMVSVLYGEGRYSGVVNVRIDGREAADISPLEPPTAIRNIEVIVQPGPEFKFSEASVRPLAPDTELPEGYARGKIAKSGLIGDAAKIATAAWRDSGHPKVDLAEENITADHAKRSVDSRLTVDPGPKLRFGPNVISGNKRVRTERVLAIAGIPTGEVYSPREVNDAAERLRRSGAFRSVSMRDAEQVGPGDQITMETTVIEQKRRRVGFGAEVSTTEGGRVSAFWMHRNLFGGAENLRLSFDVENIGTTAVDNGVDYLAAAIFRRPATFSADTDLLFRATLEREDEPGYFSDLASIGAGVAHRFSNELELRAGLDYRASRVDDAFGERQYQMITLPVNLEWDRRDNEFDATEGWYIDALVNPFTGIDNMPNGSQFELDARTYWGFGERKNTVLAGQLQFGSLFGPEIPEAPQDYLYFAGGGGSVRGQPYQSLGVGEFDGVIVGGRTGVAISGEIRSYVRGNLGVVGFVDAGYVGEEEFFDGSGNWMTGAGLGVRYRTGFGPIRVDFGTPLSGGPDDAETVQLYIGIGQAF